MKKVNAIQNAVWIEIERTDDKEANEKRAELFTNMINRLRRDNADSGKVWWYEEKNRYAFTANTEDGSWVILDDDGHLFNLDFFGRD